MICIMSVLSKANDKVSPAEGPQRELEGRIYVASSYFPFSVLVISERSIKGYQHNIDLERLIHKMRPTPVRYVRFTNDTLNSVPLSDDLPPTVILPAPGPKP